MTPWVKIDCLKLSNCVEKITILIDRSTLKTATSVEVFKISLAFDLYICHSVLQIRNQIQIGDRGEHLKCFLVYEIVKVSQRLV